MATNRRTMQLPPAAVWAVVADGFTYARWVVGTRAIRAVDQTFPAAGSSLHYTVGHGLLRHDGHTKVLDVVAGECLELEVRAWPLSVVRVVLSIRPAADGSTQLTITERPSGGPGAVIHNPVFDMLIKLRNVETLRRLESVAVAYPREKPKPP